MLKEGEATTKSEGEVPPTPPKTDDGVLRRRPVLCDQHGICYYLQLEVVLVTFEKKERGRDLEWEVDDERGEGWNSDPAKIHVAICVTSPLPLPSLSLMFLTKVQQRVPQYQRLEKRSGIPCCHLRVGMVSASEGPR